eukprot:CAMPEP_0119066616 /NCGR_PEP_ID=MMETSP1178-20130426/9121_1 /TAXON_ID=33656 /ORGANISM="unid sp, Strain CCMP2000" /LENGTH=178 /DNA_ID=CAMNT_0007048225 /DNA_START=18 /DNA_END=550 /DNA_ORIENTATION=-
MQPANHQPTVTDDAGYYAALHVDPRSSDAEIRRAYHRIARQLHPDRCQDEQAREQMALVGEAWAVLKHQPLRRAYDEDGREGVDNLSDFDEGEGSTDGSADLDCLRPTSPPGTPGGSRRDAGSNPKAAPPPPAIEEQFRPGSFPSSVPVGQGPLKSSVPSTVPSTVPASLVTDEQSAA